jgi:hypothetical protein
MIAIISSSKRDHDARRCGCSAGLHIDIKVVSGIFRYSGNLLKCSRIFKMLVMKTSLTICWVSAWILTPSRFIVRESLP